MKKTITLAVFASLILLTGCNEEPNNPPQATPPETKVGETCDTACENYALCASYGDDVTPADVDEAYATCMSECAHWETKNISCMAKATVHQPQDCLAVTMCGLNQYQGLVDNSSDNPEE